MSAFYDLASLVLVPSGYKASKVYAQKPLTTDGQLTFSRASTATRVNSAGLIEEVAANVPRLDYAPTLGQSGVSCPRLLLEPQRTNLVTFSEQFANWSNAGGTTTANTAISPSGYQDADTLTGARFQSSFGSNQYTASCFAKKVDGDNKLVLRLDIPSLKFAQFDLATGTIDSVSADYTATITPYGNGWYRCTITTPASTSISNYVIVSASGGASNTYIWGAQLEAGAYATSYIPTLGAAVTRGADFPVNLPTAISLSGDFSLFWEGTAFETDLMLYGSGNSTWYMNILGSAGRVILDTNTGRKVQGTIASLVVGTKAKVLIRRQSGAHNIFVNGVKLTNQVSVNDTTTLSLSSMFWGFSSTFYKGQAVNQSLIFKTALTDAQAIELTTL